MEKRRLIGFGNSSYVISIPKEWVKRNKLEKGASLFVDEKEGELIIQVGEKEQKRKIKETVIDASNKSKQRIQTEIVSNYLNNYSIIEIKNFKKEDIEDIKRIVQDLAGMEIMEETSTKIVAKDLINVNEASIKNLIRRIDIIVRSMFDDVISAVKENEMFEQTYKNVYQRDKDVNRLVFLVRKMITAALEDAEIMKLFNTTPLELLSDWEIVERIEKIGDQIKRIARCLLHEKVTLHSEESSMMLTKMQSRYISSMKSYYSKDYETAYDIETTTNMEVDNLSQLLHKLVSDVKDKDNIHAVILIEQLKSMCVSIRNIARGVIMNNASKESDSL